jgi:uncharacterized heparinase superfamily protein
MAKLGFNERVRIAAVRVQGFQRHARVTVMTTPLLRWRHGRPALRELVMVPGDLRGVDPSFWPEIESGLLGLSGATAELCGRSPFEVDPPHLAWARALHGFAWLRHLDGGDDGAAQAAAQDYVMAWLSNRAFSTSQVASDPVVRARRIISWLSHAPLLLEGAPLRTFDAIGRGLSWDVVMLDGTWRKAGPGYPRLLALTGLAMAHVATKGRERQLASTMGLLVDEIGRQMMSDGGHCSRNPAVLIELLLDWLPLKSCFDARGLPMPDAFGIAIARMLAMVRFLRLGDGGVARFNGVGTGDPAALATLSAYDERPKLSWGIAPDSRYGRLEVGPAVVIVDAGPAPALLLSGDTHAGCLSFEMSDGRALLFVNAGASSEADTGWRAISRATASHSTVCLGEVSSGRLVRHAGLEAMIGAVPLQLPVTVTASLHDQDEAQVFEGTHDGYLHRLGVTHTRQLRLGPDGRSLFGYDRLETKGQDRLRRDLPFAVHFHLHPSSHCALELDDVGDRIAVISLAGGASWQLTAAGAVMTLEESTFFAGNFGPRPALQIVLRGACAGASEITWRAVRRDGGGAVVDETRTFS